jgi:hypothetical protein
MFSLDEYVGDYAEHPDWTPEREGNAVKLMVACSSLEKDLIALGVKFQINPKTRTQISGEGHGGFRTQDCPIGAKHSNHKEGKAVDRYDPDGKIDVWIMGHQELLVKHGIYIEHPNYTNGWSHWGIKLTPDDAPKSGAHVYIPK